MTPLPSGLVATGLAAALVIGAAAPAASAATTTSTDASGQTCTTTTSVTEGSLSWGIRQSWRNYMQNAFFGNDWTTDGVSFTGNATGADGAFVFPVSAATSEVSDDAASIATTGSVHFTGHGGVLDITLSDLKVNISGSTGTITADYSSKDMDDSAKTNTGDDAVIATLTGVSTSSSAEGTTTTYTITSAAGALGEAAPQVFGSYYTVGGEADAASLTVTTQSTTSCTTPDPEPSDEPSDEPSTEPSEGPSAGSGTNATPGTNTGTTPNPGTGTTPNPDTSTNQTTPAVTSGALAWGIKQSWRNYMQMAFNDGWTMDGVTFSGEATGADGAFLFPVAATGSTLDASGNGTLATTGSVRFTGHGGALDLTLSNLKVTVSGTTGTITADYSSKDMTDASKTNTGQGAVIATLADVTVSSQTTDGLTTWTISSPTVAFGADAPTVFGPNYKVGQAVDAMTLTVGTSASGATAPAPNGSTSTGTKTDTLSQATGVTTTNTPAPAGTTQAATSSEPVCQAEGYQVSSGSLSWGLKSSFLSYIQGSIAKGAIATSGGASRSGSGFTFAASSGTADPQAGTASIRYSGTVHFTGHEGKLDMTIANPTLVIASPTSGYLMLTVSSTDMQGNSTSYGAIRFAEVTFSSTSVTSSRISATASAVSLTAEGAKAFAGFYSAGQALDTLTASASLTDKIVCRNADGSLATTGADAVLPLTLIATFLAVSGGVVLAGARRRHATGRLSALR